MLELSVMKLLGYFDAKKDEKVGEALVAVRSVNLAQEKQRVKKPCRYTSSRQRRRWVQSQRRQKEKQVPLFTEMADKSLPELALLDPADRNQRNRGARYAGI